MRLENLRLTRVALAVICLVTLCMSVTFLYRTEAMEMFRWDQVEKEDKLDVVLKTLRNHVQSLTVKYDRLTKQLASLDQQSKAIEEQNKVIEGQNKVIEEQTKQKADDNKGEELDFIEKQQAERDAKKKAEQEENERAKQAEHVRLEKIFNEMSARDEMNLLRDIHVDNPQPRGDKIVVVSGSDQGSRDKNNKQFDQAMENRNNYCKYHGYKHHYVDTTQFPLDGLFGSWNKVPALRKAFDDNPQAEWFWWLDTDAIIMNEKLDLAKHILDPRVIPERITWGRPIRDAFKSHKFVRTGPQKNEVDLKGIGILMTHDNNGWNAGSMFIRNTPEMRWFLDMWDNPVVRDVTWRNAEQSAITQLVLSSDKLMKKVGTMPQRLFNSYFEEKWEYVEGDLVLHFAGAAKWRNNFDEIWEKYYNSRIKAFP